MAPLVGWPLEPAWDTVTLIAGYELAPPERDGDGVIVPVRYTTVAQIGPDGIATRTATDRVRLRLEAGPTPGSWRIAAPPPPPRVFDSHADRDALAALLGDGGPYRSASAWAWGVLREAGWPGAPRPAAAALGAPGLVAPPAPQPGDLAVFLAGGEPFHLGIARDEGLIESVTITAGRVRTPPTAFGGTVVYRRPAH